MTFTIDAAAGTATTAGARAHARAQHDQLVETMRHVPASSAPEPLAALAPEGADAADLVWAESLAFGRYTTATLARGTRVRFVDTAGDACLHVLLYRASDLHERLNVADTVKVPWQAYPGAGHPLLSGAGRLLSTIVADTSGHHDALTGTTTRAGNEARYGSGSAHSTAPAGRELLTLGALKHGLERRDVPPSVTLFKGSRVRSGGAIEYIGGSGEGRAVDVLLQVDVVLVVANTAHPLDDREEFTGTAADIVAWAAPDDLAGLCAGHLPGDGTTAGAVLGPEHRQALHNTESDLRARTQR